MDSYEKNQTEGFQKFKELMKEKGMTKTMEEYIERLDAIFSWYVIVDFDWNDILEKSKNLTGDKLNNYVCNLVEVADSYDE